MFLPGCCSTSAPVILEQPSDTVVARGEPVTLNCKVKQQASNDRSTWIDRFSIFVNLIDRDEKYS